MIRSTLLEQPQLLQKLHAMVLWRIIHIYFLNMDLTRTVGMEQKSTWKHYKNTRLHLSTERSFSPVKNNMPTMNWILKIINIIGCVKLSALHMYDNGYDIIKINHHKDDYTFFDIIAKK